MLFIFYPLESLTHAHVPDREADKEADTGVDMMMQSRIFGRSPDLIARLLAIVDRS